MKSMRSKVITRGIAGVGRWRPFFPSGARHRRQLRGLLRPISRGDLAYAQETYPEIAPDSTFVSSPSVLNAYSVGAGFGHKVNDWFRTDLILDYRSKNSPS
jgi:hypothetical protein